MATTANSMALAAQARRNYVEGLLNGLPSVVQAVEQGARILLGQVADPATAMRRRDTVEDLKKRQSDWLDGMLRALRSSQNAGGISGVKPADLPAAGGRAGIVSSGSGGLTQFAARTGDDGPRLLGVHRHAFAHDAARGAGRARYQ